MDRSKDKEAETEKYFRWDIAMICREIEDIVVNYVNGILEDLSEEQVKETQSISIARDGYLIATEDLK